MVDLPTKVWIANEIRVWGLVATALLGLITLAAAWSHSRWQAELSGEQDERAKQVRRDSEERVALAKAAAAYADARAAEARLEAEKIKERLAWREVTAEQRAALIEALQGGPPIIIEFTWLSTDPEASTYAEQLLAALDAAGVRGNSNPAIYGGPVYGVRISQTFSSEAERLKQALTKAGIPFTYSAATNELRMSVGSKPRIAQQP